MQKLSAKLSNREPDGTSEKVAVYGGHLFTCPIIHSCSEMIKIESSNWWQRFARQLGLRVAES